MYRFAAVAAFASLSLSPAAAQEPAPAAADIVVVGERAEEAVRRFVGAMSTAPRGADQLARWDRRVCAGVAGLQTRYAQFLIDRMAQRAFDIDLDVGEPGCQPNVLIVVSPDPDAVARDLYDNHRGALGYFYESGEATRGRAALRETFLHSDAPVRWWHVSHAASGTGQDIARTSPAPCGRPSGGDVLDIAQCYSVNSMGGASRLRANTRQDFGAAFIIVDANRLEEIDYDFNALADYLTMVSLTQLDPQGDTSSFPTVLNLWRSDPAPNALTDWDLAYLRGLYSAEREARSVRSHEGEIAREMLGEQEE